MNSARPPVSSSARRCSGAHSLNKQVAELNPRTRVVILQADVAFERSRPTALAAGLALIPLALGAGKPGSELEALMAIVILFGLLSSTFLNMVVVPAVYYRFGKRPV
jgi:Cu/Ag efflux pump CusA